MANNRRVLISNLPQDITSNEIIQELFQSQNFKYSNINLDGSSAVVTLANANEAKRAAKLINGQLLRGMRIMVSEAPPPMRHQREASVPSSGGSFVVVGNLPFDFTEEQFRDLMSPHGDIKNLFLVRGKISKKSKGYGFVDYKQKGSAIQAKEHFMKSKGKFVEGRIIRVETTTPNQSKGEAKHSRTLFVDKLPKSFDDEEQLRNVFSSAGIVTYCKVARTREGNPRGYALLDYSTVLEAEKAQQELDGTQIGDVNIRISFCTPGKTAQDIFGKFDDQTGGGQGPGMVGPRGPRIPNLLGVNTNPLMPIEAFGGIPGFPQPGPLRTPFGIGGIVPMPRPRIPMDIMRPPGPIPGPTLRVPVTQPGSNMRTPRIRTPGVRAMRPNTQAGQVFQPKKKANVVTIKPKSASATKTSNKGSELASKVKTAVDQVLGKASKEKEQSKDTTKDELEIIEVEPPKAKAVVKEPSQAKETTKDAVKAKDTTDGKAKPEEKHLQVSTPDPLAALQKLGESAVAAAMSQSSAEGGQVKVLQPVVFMDTEQLKQFQQFQELMKQQKEAEKSGESIAVSLEDLVAAAKGLKTAEKTQETDKPETDTSKSSDKLQQKSLAQKQEPSKRTPQQTGQAKSVKSQPLPATSKPSPVVSKPSSASTKPSDVKMKPSPVSTKPSPATIKPSPAAIKLSPAIANSSSIPARQSPYLSKHSPSVSKPSPVVSKPSPVVSKPSPVVSKPSPVVSKPSPVVSKANVTSKSPATTKPSSTQTRSNHSKQETQRGMPRQEKAIAATSSRNSFQRTPQHQQRSQVEEQQSIKLVGSYERNRNSYHESKPANSVSRNDGPSSLPPAPLKPSGIASSLLQKLFGAKSTNKQEYDNDQRTSGQADSRSHHGSPYQSGGKSNLPVSEASRGTPKSSQQSQYGYSQQYQSTDGRDYASKRSPANDRQSPVSQSSSRSRYTLPERLPQARGNGESSHTTPPRYERNQERELISYPRPRSNLPPRQDTPSARDMKPPYVSPQSRDTLEPRDPLPSRDMRSIHDSPLSRNVSSLRDILPARDSSPLSRDALPPRDRSSHDYLPRDLPHRDVSPRNLPPHDVSPRDMPRSRDTLPPRDLPSRDILPSRGMPPRDDRYARDLPPSSFMREMESPRDRDPYKDSAMRYQSSSASTREALDRARYERAMAGSRDARSDHPAYGREPDGRYGRDLPTRESAMGTIRGPPARYPMEGPQSKRPRY